MFRRLLAILLAAAICVGSVPVSLAEEYTEIRLKPGEEKKIRGWGRLIGETPPFAVTATPLSPEIADVRLDTTTETRESPDLSFGSSVLEYEVLGVYAIAKGNPGDEAVITISGCAIPDNPLDMKYKIIIEAGDPLPLEVSASINVPNMINGKHHVILESGKFFADTHHAELGLTIASTILGFVINPWLGVVMTTLTFAEIAALNNISIEVYTPNPITVTLDVYNPNENTPILYELALSSGRMEQTGFLSTANNTSIGRVYDPNIQHLIPGNRTHRHEFSFKPEFTYPAQGSAIKPNYDTEINWTLSSSKQDTKESIPGSTGVFPLFVESRLGPIDEYRQLENIGESLGENAIEQSDALKQHIGDAKDAAEQMLREKKEQLKEHTDAALNRANDLKDRAVEKFNETRGNVSQGLSDAKDAALNKAGELQSTAAETLSEAKNALNNAKNTWSAAANHTWNAAQQAAASIVSNITSWWNQQEAALKNTIRNWLPSGA